MLLRQVTGELTTIATTHEDFTLLVWQAEQFFTQLFEGKTLPVFDVSLIPEWKPHLPLSTSVVSALHMPIQTQGNHALFIATHSERGFFTREKIALADRFRPMVAQALQNVELHNAVLTERDRLEESVVERTQAVVDTQKRYRSVIDTALDAVVGINDEGKITDWNQQAETIFGWSNEEALGQ